MAVLSSELVRVSESGVVCTKPAVSCATDRAAGASALNVEMQPLRCVARPNTCLLAEDLCTVVCCVKDGTGDAGLQRCCRYAVHVDEDHTCVEV